jgi:phage regulator Rha-like protein
MSKDGFILLPIGFTSKAAVRLKVAYVPEWLEQP